jgi:carbamoyl-phosphate synthase large subunit
MFPEVDPLLGPEMRSTGEVLGLADSMGMSFYKAQEATQTKLPLEGTVLFSIAGDDKSQAIEVAKEYESIGFNILATEGTHRAFIENGIQSTHILKIHEGRPNIADKIIDGEIQLVINTPIGKKSQYDDSYIRKAAIKYKIPYITTLAAAAFSVKGIADRKRGNADVKSVQSYHADIK